jgi:hypothetical protein
MCGLRSAMSASASEQPGDARDDTERRSQILGCVAGLAHRTNFQPPSRIGLRTRSRYQIHKRVRASEQAEPMRSQVLSLDEAHQPDRKSPQSNSRAQADTEPGELLTAISRIRDQAATASSLSPAFPMTSVTLQSMRRGAQSSMGRGCRRGRSFCPPPS